MAEWLIRVFGKQRKEIDKHLLVQAVLAYGRQLSGKDGPSEPDNQAEDASASRERHA